MLFGQSDQQTNVQGTDTPIHAQSHCGSSRTLNEPIHSIDIAPSIQSNSQFLYIQMPCSHTTIQSTASHAHQTDSSRP